MYQKRRFKLLKIKIESIIRNQDKLLKIKIKLSMSRKKKVKNLLIFMIDKQSHGDERETR